MAATLSLSLCLQLWPPVVRVLLIFRGRGSMQLYRGLKSIIYMSCTQAVLILCFFGSVASAQSGTPSAPVNTAPPTSATSLPTTGLNRGADNSGSVVKTTKAKALNDPNSAEVEADKGSKKKTNNQAVAQGLSVAEAMLLNPSPWGFFLSTSISRGLDEYQDALASSSSLDATYRINAASSVNLSLGYNTIVYNYDGEFLYNKSSDPGQYGLADTDISYVRPNVWSDKYNRLVLSAGLTLPTSRLSSRSGLNAATRFNAALRYKPISKLIITPSVGTYVRSFRYDTPNIIGSSFNSPFGFTYGLSGSYVFLPWLIGSLGYSQTQRYDFNNDWRVIQAATAQMSISLNALNLYAGYQWRDRIETNEPLFDDDKSLIYTGVGYAF